MHLVGFIIGIYHDARSSECHMHNISRCTVLWMSYAQYVWHQIWNKTRLLAPCNLIGWCGLQAAAINIITVWYVGFPLYIIKICKESIETGRVCSTYGRQEECIQSFGGKTWGKETDHLEHQDVGGRIILKRVFKELDGDMDWIDLAQDRDKLQAVVNTVMNIQINQPTRCINLSDLLPVV